MKLKSVLSLAIACGMTLAMSVMAHAASEVKVSGATVDEYGATLPVVLNTTDTGKSDNVSTYDITVKYDSSVWQYDGYNDPNTYTKRGQTYQLGTVYTNDANNQNGEIHMTYSCIGANGYPVITDGKLTLVEVYLTPKTGVTVSEIKDSSFSVGVNFIEDEDVTDGVESYPGSEMNSYFTFDVTGDLDGNEIVGLAASTDGGATKQDLDKYVSTTLTKDSTDYASATTKFLVSVANTQGADAVTDITIYGKLEDGTYIPLSSLDQKDFLVQTFEQ